MARKLVPLGMDERGKLDEGTLRRFVFRTFGRARRTQDSPVMPDVWLRYIRIAEKIANSHVDRSKPPNGVVDLLLTPWSGDRPGEIAATLRECLKTGQEGEQRYRDARVALSASRVVACVDFRTLVQVVVPLTGWWKAITQKKNGSTSFLEKFDVILKRVDEKRPRGSDIELFR
jgi:serine protease AprX